MKEEICEKCGRKINLTEQAYVFQGVIVCSECDKRLRNNLKLKTHGLPKINQSKPNNETKATQKGAYNPSYDTFGGPIGTIIFVFMIFLGIPLLRTCTSELNYKSNRARERHISSSANTLSSKDAKYKNTQGRAVLTRPQKKQSIAFSSENSVYSNPQGSGGSYKDPINGYFEVQPPVGFQIKERRDKGKFTIREGSSHIGEVVATSFIQFVSNNKASITVTARKTFTTIEHDFQTVLDGLPKKFSGIKIYRNRFITIDGVKGGEILATLSGQKLLIIKYKKYGLDHTITINCDVSDFPKFEEAFMSFLRSYRSLDQKKVPDRTKAQKKTESFPVDGVYSKDIGSGGSYKDPIHGFFEVEPPKGFKIEEKWDRTTTTFDDGTIVPCSRVNFQSNKARIAVVTRKTFKGTIEEDSKIAVNNLRSAGAKIATKRFITIDGSKGLEVGGTASGYRLLIVKYKKNGLDHAITASCSPADFSSFQKDLINFLRSYRSLEHK